MKLFRDLTREEFSFPLRLDVQGSFSVTKEALPHLEKTRGNLVYLSSMSGNKFLSKLRMSTLPILAQLPMPHLDNHDIAKAAINHLARHVALEEGHR